jgi:uncharacterized protein DUF4136
VKSLKLLALALATCVLGTTIAAQKVEIETNRDEKADFTKIKTYFWLPPAPLVKNTTDALSNPNLSQEVLGPHIIAAVDREFARRGFTQTDNKEAADVLVAYFAALTVGFSRTYLGEYYGYVTGWGSPIPPGFAPTTSSTIYEQGAIVIDVVDRAANRAIWRGVARTRVHQDRKLDTRIERINDAAERMFQKFPIRPNK